jgi:hypothetical protein
VALSLVGFSVIVDIRRKESEIRERKRKAQ